MRIEPVPLTDRRRVRRFLRLPFDLYRGVPQWVPPLAADAARVLDPHRHPFYRHSQASFFLAVEGGRDVGRLAVLDNHNHNTFNAEHTAFFCLFECIDALDASQGLFESAFAWARGCGLERIVGPKGFSALDGLGLLVRGFEHRPALGIPYNPPHHAALIEAAGFAASGEIISGYLHRTAAFPQRIHDLAARVQRRRGLRIARYRSRADLRALVPRLGRLYNETLGGTSGNVPLTQDEVRSMAGQMLAFADPRLVKVVMHGDEPVGFVFAYPDISAALQRCRGRLLPFGWLDLLLELRRTRRLNINGAGIVERYRGLGGTALLFSELHKTVVESRFEHAEVVQIGLENANMQRELRDLGIDFYKAHRMYARAL